MSVGYTTHVYFLGNGSSTSINGGSGSAYKGLYKQESGYFSNNIGDLTTSDPGVGDIDAAVSQTYFYNDTLNAGFFLTYNNLIPAYLWYFVTDVDPGTDNDGSDADGSVADSDANNPGSTSGFYGYSYHIADHQLDGDVVIFEGGSSTKAGIFTSRTGYKHSSGSTIEAAEGQTFWYYDRKPNGDAPSYQKYGFFKNTTNDQWYFVEGVDPEGRYGSQDLSGSSNSSTTDWGTNATYPDGTSSSGDVVYLARSNFQTSSEEGGGGAVTANAPTLKLKRGAQANLPTLAIGEPGFTTDSYQLYVGSPAGNKLIGGNDFFSLEGASTGGGINLYEGTSNGSDYIQLKAPDSLAGITTYTLPGVTTAGYYLQSIDSTGTLTWSEVVSSFDIAADSGSNDTVSTGQTITFAGTANEVNTAVTNNTITIGLPDAVVIASTLSVNGTSYAGLSANVDNLVTLSGVSSDSTDLGTFTGSTISDSRTVKQALQDLETSLESVSGGGAQASSVSVGSTDANSTHYLTFVDGLNANPTQESIQNDAGITYNPSTNILTVSGSISADVTGDLTGEVNASTFDTNAAGQVMTGVTTVTQLQIGTVGQTLVGITTILDEDDLSSDSATALPTQQSVKAYVDALDLTTSLAGDSGTGSVSTSQTLTISGTANEVNTSVSGQTVTVGLPDTVNITTELDVPTIEVTDIQARDGTASITITNSTGAVSIADSLTVSGDLYVNGTQTYVNTTQMTVEDTLIELQVVDGGSLSSDTNKDVGMLFNYYADSLAKKAAVFWDDSTSRIGFGKSVSESSGVLTVQSDQWATIEVGGLTVSDSVGVATAIITVSGSDRVLQNVLVDCGSF